MVKSKELSLLPPASWYKDHEERWPHALVPGASGPDSSPGRGHCLVFLGKTWHLTLTVPLSTHAGVSEGGVTCDELASRPGEVELLLAASCYRNRDKLRQLWVSRLRGFTFFFFPFSYGTGRPQFSWCFVKVMGVFIRARNHHLEQYLCWTVYLIKL